MKNPTFLIKCLKNTAPCDQQCDQIIKKMEYKFYISNINKKNITSINQIKYNKKERFIEFLPFFIIDEIIY